MSPARAVYAQVVRPSRWWESGHKMRAGNYGMIFTDDSGELPISALPDEILLPGKGQIKALISVGGNPASAFPDQVKTVQALRSLELLVAVEPFMTTTARLADYVIPPRLMYERVDIPIMFGQGARLPVPFTQYTYAIDIITAGGQIALDEIRRHPHGKTFPIEQIVEPARPDQDGRFEAMPEDVADELARYLAAPRAHEGFTHRLTVRRMRQTMDSLVSAPELLHPSKRFNPAFLHPSELDRLGITSGDRIEIQSGSGRLIAVAEADDSILRGVVSMSHSWGGLPDDPPETGGSACTAILVNTLECEPVNAMPVMTALPIKVSRFEGASVT